MSTSADRGHPCKWHLERHSLLRLCDFGGDVITVREMHLTVPQENSAPMLYAKRRESVASDGYSHTTPSPSASVM